MTIFQLDLHRIALLGIMFCAVPAAAQFPEKFTNLQVLPKDISRKQFESTMRGFPFALNVWLCLLPCEKPNAKKFEMDFASEDKDTKKTARVMLANGSSHQPRLHQQVASGSDAAGPGAMCHLSSRFDATSAADQCFG